MSEGNDSAVGVNEPQREEFTRCLVLSAYLYIFFSATPLCKAALLAEQGVRFVPLGFAFAKALILGNVGLIRESVRIGTAR